MPYQPGTLKAVGTKDGKVVAEVEVSTTGEPAAIELSVDRDAIAADRRDVAHFTVKILDAQGRVVPVADNEVAFEIQGEGKIIGVDNGNPVSHEDFKGKTQEGVQRAVPGHRAIDGQSGPDSTDRDFARAQVRQRHDHYRGISRRPRRAEPA